MKNEINDQVGLAEVVFGTIEPTMLAETVEGLLRAEARGRDGSTVPDHRTRLDTARLVIEHVLGRPVQRQHIVEEKRHQSMDELMDDWRRSPSLFLAAERQIREARKTLEAEGVIEPGD